MMTAWVIALFLAVMALASGCEDTPLTAAKDDEMFLVALPSTVHADPANPTESIASTIVATVVSAAGTPREGLLVFFGADGGQLTSGTQPVTTDSGGNAQTTLLVDPGGPGSITVTSSSASLSETVTVTNGACSDNPAPTASFAVTDPAAGHVGDPKPVALVSTSTDVLPGMITSYDWNCGNGTSEVGHDATCDYTVEATKKTYTITLTVKDNGLASGTTAPFPCQKSATITHPVVIDVLPASR
jgi:hypothetical protein